jgi:hypothetical protein
MASIAIMIDSKRRLPSYRKIVELKERLLSGEKPRCHLKRIKPDLTNIPARKRMLCRFSDACHQRPWIAPSCRRPKTCTQAAVQEHHARDGAARTLALHAPGLRWEAPAHPA